ncbi:MAG: SDR family NAD(P)-dependent oxidoreductase [Acidobacteria bacterium]|nr:SDR family NAD(P)-dependent oxidoreductase [Acidobacteriota bacterium]
MFSARRSHGHDGRFVLLGSTALAIVGGLLALRRRAANYRLEGRTVLITGGSRGLGFLLAQEFSRRGARVAICARDPEELERARAELKRRGHKVLTIVCDVSVQAEVEQAIERVREELGLVDVLVNNAGTITVGPIETMTAEDYRESLDTHFWGPLYAAMAVLPDMRSRREGRIVNISSIGGKISVPHLVPYSSGKFALTGFSEGLRSEASKDNIKVTTVCPGLMRTGSPRNAKFKGRHRSEYAWFSISDALPLFSISADRAARSIVHACVRGDTELVLSVPAKLAVLLHGLFPGTFASVLSIANWLLPGSPGRTTEPQLGRESYSALSPSFLTFLDERAARRNNEIR